ncbi:MAG: hypothetical protein BroJett013_22900 [Alphaproteobacteria bacterium]|nr:MAG: hypothetical protein BroJett013_22900 [Alphaproteobacteria bacterium]
MSDRSPFIDERPDLPSIPKPAQQRAGVKPGERVPDETLVAAVEDGSELHAPLRDLAMRGWTEEQLYALMERSTAKETRPVDWTKRRSNIPRLVKSAAKKLAPRDPAHVFGDAPQTAPNNAIAAPAPNAVQLPLMRPADFKARPVFPRRWIVPDLMPQGEPTLVYGAGATGKSLLLLQLCICMASGRKWLDRDVPSGRALFFTCEDTTDEINRRASSILKALGITWADCGDRLLIVPMRDTDVDATLADENVEATPTYWALKEASDLFKPDLRVIDTLADVFAGDENRRADAKRFVKIVTRLGSATDIVTAHPSVAGTMDGRGASGSTGWPAAVRSHLFFDRVREGDGRELDPDLRRLRNLKANYSRGGAGEIELKWTDGAFVAADGGVPGGAFDAPDVDELFLRLLRSYAASGRYVNSSSGASYAPSAFASEPEAKRLRVRKADLRDAMQRLFAAGRITNATRTVDRKTRTFIAVVEGKPTPAPWLGDAA